MRFVDHQNVIKLIGCGFGEIKIYDKREGDDSLEASGDFETMDVSYIVTELAQEFDMQQLLQE